ncbi:MAG TPA: ornithine cyclodeaminase family protein [Candidatus Binatia bacterium]|nr:ornithine cyclodeaminase family protein [Candidatus Binatia bacterium]
MSDRAALWIREAEVVALIDLADAIAALERALAAEGRGDVSHLEKTHTSFAGGDLHALGAVVADGLATGGGLAGTKTWAHTAGGANPLLVLWRASDGRLQAVIEAFALGQLRTSGISALATRLLADPGADELAIVGSGKQALAQVAAVAAARPLRRVRIHSPTAAHREAFAERIDRELRIPARAAPSLRECTADAPVVTVVTRARAPFLESALLARGAHVNAVGAIAPDRAEIARDVFPRVALAVADSPSQVRRLSREFREAYGWDAAGAREGATIGVPVALSELVAGRAARPADADLTLFKAMGMGLSDVALGAAVLERARARGVGRPIDPPERAAPRLLTTTPAKRHAGPGGEA